MAMPNLARRHLRLWAAVAAGILSFVILPGHGPLVSRALISWNVTTSLFSLLAYIWMYGKSSQQIGLHYKDEDESAPVILLIVTISALASLIAIVVLLQSAKHATPDARVMHVCLAGLTVVSSWLMVATIFTLHYAELFYNRQKSQERPLTFPKTPMPGFWDFAYFSFTIAAACQTSDVATAQGNIRRIVLLQTIVSFIFNVAIVGFAINVSAGILGGS